MRGITATTLRDRYAGLVGVDALTTDEEAAYLASLNDRIRSAWYRFEWPDLIEIVQVPLQRNTTTNEWVSDNLTQDVLSLWNGIPTSSRVARQVGYTLVDGKVVLSPFERVGSVEIASIPTVQLYGLMRKAPPTYEISSTDIPEFFESYLLRAVYADYLKSDGQAAKAAVEDERAENYLIEAMDRMERSQDQRAIKVRVYPSPIIYNERGVLV